MKELDCLIREIARDNPAPELSEGDIDELWERVKSLTDHESMILLCGIFGRSKANGNFRFFESLKLSMKVNRYEN